jgi:hypothetical protein
MTPSWNDTKKIDSWESLTNGQRRRRRGDPCRLLWELSNEDDMRHFLLRSLNICCPSTLSSAFRCCISFSFLVSSLNRRSAMWAWQKRRHMKMSDKFTGLLDYCNLLLAMNEPALLGSPPAGHESASTPGLTPLDMRESVPLDSPPSGAGWVGTPMLTLFCMNKPTYYPGVTSLWIWVSWFSWTHLPLDQSEFILLDSLSSGPGVRLNSCTHFPLDLVSLYSSTHLPLDLGEFVLLHSLPSGPGWVCTPLLTFLWTWVSPSSSSSSSSLGISSSAATRPPW